MSKRTFVVTDPSPGHESDELTHEVRRTWAPGLTDVWSLDTEELLALYDAIVRRAEDGGFGHELIWQAIAERNQAEADERGERHRLRFAGPEYRQLSPKDTWQPPYDE